MKGERSYIAIATAVVGWLLRIAVGATFIFSGFSKAVDPYGTFYKIGDYVAAWGWHLPDNIVLTGAFGLFSLEFALGLMLLLGCFRRAAAIASLVVMAFMLPLSLWLALADPVADCGCFGDALVISNWSTFWKNVILTLGCIWLVRDNTRLHWLVTPALQWVSLTLSIAYPVCLGLTGYLIQPPVDFRPYKVGGPLVEVGDDSSDQENVKLIYKGPDGKEDSFSVDAELPSEEDGWTFVRQEKSAPARPVSRSSALRIYQGDEDVTSDVVRPDTRQLVLFMPSLSDINVRDTWPINSLYAYCRDYDIDMFAVAAASPEAVEAWQDISLAEYPVYTAEDTSIKEVVRGNPALVFLESGRITWKQTLEATDVDALRADVLSPRHQNIESVALPVRQYMNRATLLLVLLQAILVGFSFIPVAWRHCRKPSKKESQPADADVRKHG
mgnify:CR=1 FL=1